MSTTNQSRHNSLCSHKNKHLCRILQHPSDYIQPLEEALAETIDKKHWDKGNSAEHVRAVQDAGEAWRVGFEGPFGSFHVTPRNLLSNLLGSLVKVEGIVTKCECQSPYGALLRDT